MRRDGVTQTLTAAPFTTGEVIDWTVTNHAIGATTGGSAKLNGQLADLWIDDQFIANTDANVLKFISALSSSGLPVDLGATGATPGFGQPLIYLSRRNGAADFSANKGSGGGFTVTGALTDGTTVT
jgi:hypothetical protein